MDRIAAALGDAARWRIVELLAERPRSVGELAELTGLRQPQTTKHLQTLARAGLVTAFPLGRRRVHALEAAPLAALVGRLRELADATEAHAGERDVVARYRATIEAEAAAAGADGWADGRTFSFDRLLPAPADAVWRHWTDADLLASWWVPPSLTVTACVVEPWPGGRVVLGYRDADGEYHAEGRVRVAEEPARLGFDLAVTGPASFTGHYDLELDPDPGGTRLRLGLRITATTVGAVPFVAGIETGWGQVLDHLTDVLSDRKG
ncbi:metalloregulator ArsR/SmtB family transcription factor [Amycolatopsis sp.]|uniref:metalloregulator ArsR/SmtB family transcription factor n=1 Tax=Amycolatopsis sp. TaxID=37632 RepID=UPI002D810307|nr:metalloregulator ArsR/SmtB family transcription factor [Amycolatopsis sp.]HET6707203.1 metalloregulator ArsR/SmtB family transcription factor [Amycolatopsis sp.]